ncbi:hypothetical protein CPC08DRAFT_765813 [Agrocybe pediades]|nr:hypothetical protein CPC08DRAFT_765813 [Agrocybe pediades]
MKIGFKLTSSLLETFNVRSDSLTHLTVKEMSVERCMDTIRGSPVLRYFKTGLTDAVPIEDFVPPLPVVHEVLESLALLVAMDPNLLDRLLPLLTLPALHTLDLDLVGNQDPHIVQDFLRRSSAPITSMKHMYEQECHSRNLPSFQAITAHTPSLTHLHLYYDDILEKDNAEYVDTTILIYLVETGKPRHDDPSYTPPLPQLQSLTCTSPRVNMPKLIPCDILPGLFPFSTPGSGEPSLRPIKSLITSESCWPGEPYLRALLPLRQAGIDFGHRNTTLDSMAALA